MNRDIDNPFDILDGRMMISLGPLSSETHCSFSCPFCYVPKGFLQYSTLDIPDICEFVGKATDVDIIYISGDTDSFAPPRMDKGLDLLEKLAYEFSKDILITTRISMDMRIIKRLKKVARILENKNKKLFVCISISSPDENKKIEPLPIPSVNSRIETLALLKNNGLCAILAMRPFLPIYCFDDYKGLIDSLKNSVDLILGEVWYHDAKKEMWERLTGKPIIHRGVSQKTLMPFNENDTEWEEWNDPQMEKDIANFCKTLGIPFFMRSSSAIKYLRAQSKS